MALLQRYDKFSYSHQRNNSEREVVSPSSPGRKNFGDDDPKSPNGQHQKQKPSSSSSGDLYIHHDPSASVLNPLRHGAYSFAIAEDGILHSRNVAPPRICYAPVISELDVPHALPQTPWQRLNAILINSLVMAGGVLPSVKFSDEQNNNNNDDNEAGNHDDDDDDGAEVLSASASVKALNRSRLAKIASGNNNNNNGNNNNCASELDFETFGSFEWSQIEQALKLLAKEDAERDEALIALLASGDQEGESIEEKGRKLAFFKEKKQTFDIERVTAVDQAKIELIWKKARIMSVNVEAKRTAEKAKLLSLSRKNSQNRMLASGNNNNNSATNSPLLLAKRSSGSGFNNKNPENENNNISSRPQSGSSRGSSPGPNNNNNNFIRSQSQGSNKSVGGESSSLHNNEITSRRTNNNNSSSSVFGGRGTIFNEKLKWSTKPKVDSNNNNNINNNNSSRF